MADFWMEEFMTDGGLCVLCGNYGVVDTRGIKSPAGTKCGARVYCICPNGRKMKKLQVNIDTES